MSTSQFTNKEIADYVFAVLGGAGTDAEKAAAINAAAQQYDVTRERLAASTGYGLDVVNQYLGALPTTNAGVTPTSTGVLSTVTATQPYSATSGSAVDTTSSATSALSNQVASAPIGGGTATPTGALPTSTTQGALQATGALQTAASTTDAAKTAPTGGLANAVDTAASSAGTDTTQSALSNVATAASTTQGALSNVATAVDPRLSEVKSYWEQTTGDKTYAGLTDDQILKHIVENPSNYKQAIEKAAADLNRNNAIKNQFLSIYDDPNKTGYEKAQEIKALAATSKVSDAEIASALGFTGADGTTLLNTFLNQPDPTTRAIQTSFANIYNDNSLNSYEKAQKINQLASTNKVSRDQLSTALNIDKKNLDAFLDQPDPTTAAIQTSFADIYNNKDLTHQQKAQQINQLASTNKVSRDQIATALGINSANLNTYLDQDPTVINSLLATANDSSYKPENYTYATDYEGYQYRVLSEQGIAAQRARADAGRRLEALGYELFDPDGPAYQDDFGTVNDRPAKWLSPQEAASVTGTKINNQLRNQAYVQNTDYLAPSLSPLANQLRQSLDAVNSSGGMLVNHPAYFYNKIAEELTARTGITNLDDIGYRKLEGRWIDAGGDPPVAYFIRSGSDQIELYDDEFYNKQTGYVFPNGRLPYFKHGIRDNETAAYFKPGPDGKPKLTTYYAHEGEDWQDWIAPLAIITAPLTVGSSLAALGAGEAALLAAESGLFAGGLGVPGAGYGAGALGAGSLTSSLTSALPTELVQAGQTLANTFNTVKPYLQAGNALYQASQGNIANALLSGLDAAGGFGVSGAKELGQALNAGLAASKGNYFPALNFALNQTGIGSELANTKIAGDFTVGDAVKGMTFAQAAASGDPTQILNVAASLTGSQDLKVAAAANGFINTLNNPNATAFDIAMGVSRVSDALNTASKQPPPKGALQTSGQSTVTGVLGTDTTSGATGRDVIDEYNVTGGGGALISSGNPTEDQQIAIQQRQNAANQALTDYMGPGNDLSREGLVSQLQSLGLTADQAEGYAQQADQKINMNLVGADVMNRYSKIDPEFGTPQLDRDTAVQEMVAAGFTSDRANEILNGIDAQNAIKLENKLSIQSAYSNFTSGKGTEEQLRSALTSAGYTDAEINNLVTRGNAILEGSRLTAGEQAQERASQLPDVRAEIAAKPTFSEAYRLARNSYGSGATFTWQGKLYSTDTFQENPALGLVPVAGSGRGQASGKTAEQEAALLATAEELRRIDPAARAALLDPASINYSEMSPESNAQGLTQTAADKLVQSAIPVNAIKTAFGMTTEAAGNTLKAFGTIGESMGFNTAQMSDYGRRLENIAQELYPQALKSSEDEVKGRFASANSAADIGRAIKDSILNNPGAVAKMIGVEGLQEIPNILLAVSTGGASAIVRYSGLLAGLGLDVVESAGLQGAQKVDEGLAKGLTRAQAVKSAVDDMKAAGTVTAVMTAAADKIPFGGTVAKTLIKGSAGEGIEEYVIARATGQDHMSALRQAAFGAMIGGPTEASLQGAGNLTNVTINGDTMIGTYEDGTKVSISEPAGATDLKIDIIKPTDTSVNVSNTLTADLSSGADLSMSINNVVSNNITADLSGTIDSTVKAVIDNGVDLSQGVTDLTSSAVTNTGDTTAVINNVVSSLASNGTDLNANAGSIVTGAVSGGASVTDAVDTTLKAVTANGGNVADAAASIITSVSASGDTAQVADATTAVVNAAITSGSNVTATTSNAVDAALAASGGSTDAVTQVVGGVASQGNNDATAAAVASAVTTTGDTSATVNAALTNGGDASTVLSTASNAAITAGTDTNTAVTNTLTSALNNNVDTATAVDSTVKGALDAGADSTSVIDATVTTIAQSGGDVSQAVGSAVDASLAAGADTGQTLIAATSTAITNGGDASTVVSNVVNSAVNNGVSLADATASSVATAIVSGADANSVIQTLTNSNSNLTVESGSEGGVTTVVASDGTSNTQVSMDANSQTVTTTTTNAATGETKQVTIQGDTTTEIKSDVSTGVVTQIVSNPDRDQIVTTTWNADNTVTVTTKSGDGSETTETLTADVAPVKPKLDPIAAVVPVKTAQPTKTTEPTTSASRAASLAGAMALPGMLMGEETPRLRGEMLKAEGDTAIKNPLEAYMERVEEMNRVDPALMAVMAQRLGIQLPEQSQEVKSPTFTYGQETSIDDILGLNQAPKEEEEFAYAEGGYVEPLRAKGGAMNLQFMNRGGVLPGGREDFKDGKHVAGDGDGQSDDIPAWLADGEFVFPADVVSALGNGSTKAGTDKLYKMMHEIRARARSTKVKDLPPPAHKSPLDYIKKGK